MSRNQSLIRELLKQVKEDDLENGAEKMIIVTLACGAKIHVLVKVKENEKPKLKIVKGTG